MRVPANRITAILRGERDISAETALRLTADRLGTVFQREVTPIHPAGCFSLAAGRFSSSSFSAFPSIG